MTGQRSARWRVVAAGKVCAAVVVCAASGASTVGSDSGLGGDCAEEVPSVMGNDWTAINSCATDGGCPADSICAAATSSDCPCAPHVDGVLFLWKHFHATTIPTRRSTDPENAEDRPIMKPSRDPVDSESGDASSTLSSLFMLQAHVVFIRTEASGGNRWLMSA